MAGPGIHDTSDADPQTLVAVLMAGPEESELMATFPAPLHRPFVWKMAWPMLISRRTC